MFLCTHTHILSPFNQIHLRATAACLCKDLVEKEHYESFCSTGYTQDLNEETSSLVSNEHWNGLGQRTARQGGVLQGWWLDIEAVFTTCPWGMWLNCSRTEFRKAGEECAQVCMDIKVRGCLRVKPFHVATTSCILLTYSDTSVHEHARTHKQNAQTLFLVSVPWSPDAPASGISSVSHVTGWRCDSCP